MKEEQKQALIDMMKSDEELGLYEQTKCYCGHTTTCDCGPLEPKQEDMITKIMQMDAKMAYDSLPKQDKQMNKEKLEEAAKKYDGENAASGVKSFIEGAKWMKERSYSEEDMREAFIACWKANVPDGIECKVSFNEWFEQFKKK
jgi:hypothetical protein